MLYGRILFIALMITLSGVISSLPPLYAADEPEATAEETTNYSYLINIFENKYREIAERANQGQLPATVLEEADQIRVDLKKFLISRNAELEILRVDVLEGSKEKSTAALEQMNKLIADTEQNKMMYIQKLVALSPGSGTENYAMMPAQGAQSGDSLLGVSKPSAPKRKKPRRKVEKESIWETKDMNKRMILAPEDLSMGRIK